MKKYVFSSDRYEWLKQKNKKTYKPNLSSTNESNEKVFLNNQEQQSLDTRPEIQFDETLVSHDINKRLSVIIPYRNREDHLKEFLETVPKVLESQNIDYEILIVEQEPEKLFNKGILNNIGFLETNHCDYFCFHDVDMMPIKSDYGMANTKINEFGMAIHIAKLVEQFEYKEFPNYFGGVLLIDKKAFNFVNGYSNSYWGWGIEDDDFHRRCHSNNKVMTVFRNGIYRSLKHKPNYDPDIYDKNYKVFAKYLDYKIDGFTQTKYKIISKNKLNDRTTMITVSI